MEIWKSIESFEGSYEVSNYGRVRSLDRIHPKRNGLVKGRVLKFNLCGGRPGSSRYPTVTFTDRPFRKDFLVHRLVAIYFIPNPENKPEVNHKDGDKLNNHYDNLEWCTRKENVQHSSDTGLLRTNGAHFNAKLSLKEVNRIKNQLSKGVTQSVLAERYNVCQSTISLININRNWKHTAI